MQDDKNNNVVETILVDGKYIPIENKVKDKPKKQQVKYTKNITNKYNQKINFNLKQSKQPSDVNDFLKGLHIGINILNKLTKVLK